MVERDTAVPTFFVYAVHVGTTATVVTTRTYLESNGRCTVRYRYYQVCTYRWEKSRQDLNN
jgi:hypothetical protein